MCNGGQHNISLAFFIKPNFTVCHPLLPYPALPVIKVFSWSQLQSNSDNFYKPSYFLHDSLLLDTCMIACSAAFISLSCFTLLPSSAIFFFTRKQIPTQGLLSNVCLFDEDKIYFFWSFSSWRSFFLFSLMFSQHKPETKSCSVLKHSTHIRKEILCIEGSLEEYGSFANLGSLPSFSFSSLWRGESYHSYYLHITRIPLW